MTKYADKTEATSLASELIEVARDRYSAPILDDDGVARAPSLDRDGDRLFIYGEPDVWFDIGRDGCPRTDHPDGADLPHEVRHQNAPMTEFKGWHRTEDGWVLLSTGGVSLQPEAFVPEERGRDE